MSNMRHYLTLMIIYLAIVAVVCVFLFVPLKAAFMANWGFNLVILFAFFVGIGINMYQVLRLEPEINWMKIYRTGDIGLSIAEGPRFLKSLAMHLSGTTKRHFSLSALSLQTVLEGIRGRLDESREISPLHDRSAHFPWPSGHFLGSPGDHRLSGQRHQQPAGGQW